MTLTCAIWLSMMSANAQNLTIDGGDLTIQGGAELIIQGDFHNDDTGAVSNNGLIMLNGNWVNDGSTEVFSAADTGAVLFHNAALQTIGGTGSTMFNKLEINGSGTEKEVRLLNHASCSDQVNLTDDFLNTQANNFTVDNDAANAIIRTAEMTAPFSDTLRGYVTSSATGKLIRKTASGNTYLFPVAEGGKFRPVEIQSTIANYYEVDFVASAPANQANLGAGLDDINANYYHKIDRQTNSGSTDNIIIHLDFDVDGACVNDDLTIAEYDGANWVNVGSTTNTQRATPLLSSVSNVNYPGGYATPYTSEDFVLAKTASDGNPDWEQDSCFTDCNPTVSCPADTALNNDLSNCSAVYTFSIDTSTVNCPSLTLTRVTGLASGSAFPVGATLNTFKVEDGRGTTAACSFTVTVTDNENPAITCPVDINANTTPGLCAAIVTYTVPVGTDNCTGSVTTRTAGLGSGASFSPGVNVETYRVTDATGKTADCSVSITISDNEVPAPVCRDTSISLDSLGAAVITALMVNNGSSDNCGISTLSVSPSSFGCPEVGANAVVLTTEDAAGNTATCPATVTVTNDNALSIVCPADTAIDNAAGQCNAVFNYAAVTSLSNCNGVTITQTAGLASGATFNLGTTINRFEATDASNLTTTCQFTVTVEDVELPTASCPASISLANDPDLCSAVVNYAAATSSDNCAGSTITQTSGLTSGAIYLLGVTTNAFVATDASGLSASCSFTVTVTDTQLAAVICPNDTTLDSDNGSCGAVLSYTVGFSDNCAGAALSQSNGLASGSTFSGGSTLNSFVVRDTAGNESICSFIVTVEDNEPPSVTCPADTVLNSDLGQCGAVFNYTRPTATDNCPSPISSLTAGLASGALFPVGTDTVHIIARDAADNTATCFFSVTVNDTEAPTITCPANITASANGANCDAVVNYATPAVNDNCPGASAAFSGGFGSGGTFPVGASLEVWQVTDQSGATGSCSFNVSVNDDTAPDAQCQDIAISASGSQTLVVDPLFVDNGSSDPCGLDTMFLTPESFDCEQLGLQNTVVLNVVDQFLNTSTCSANVSIVLRGLVVNGSQKISDIEGDFDATLDNKDFFGSEVAHLGDLNGDGNPDLICGSAKDDDGAGSDRGASYVLFLDENNLVKKYQKISKTEGNFGGNISTGDWFGTSVASIGDMNGDGIPDALIGAPHHDDGGTNKGAAWLVNLDNDGNVLAETKFSHSTSGIRLNTADKFGTSVASAGDINGDGVNDLAIGSPKSNATGTDRGSFWLLLMNANQTIASAKHITGADFPLGLNPLGNKDEFGSAITSLGDINGDNVPDLAVSAIKDDDGVSNGGAIYVLFMNDNGTIASSHKISATTGGFTGNIQSGDQLGYSLAGGHDFDNDGVNDLIAGSNQHNNGGADKGAVWVMLMRDNGTVRKTLKISDLSGFPGYLDKYDEFGSGLSVVASNSCGATIAVGAHQDDDGGTNRGAVYILELGSGSAKSSIFEDELTLDTDELSLSEGQDINRKLDVNLYPNPNTGQFKLDISSLENQSYSLRIVNNMGQTVHLSKSEQLSGAVTKNFDLAYLAEGVYHLMLHVEDEQYDWKLFIVK